MKKVLITAILLGIAAGPEPARAFNWNGKGATSELDTLDGRFHITSGHPLAAYRSFQIAGKRANEKTRLAFQSVLGEDYLDKNGDALQTALFGGWLNEVQSTLDMGEDKTLDPMTWVSRFMGWRYGNYLKNREHSDRWDEYTGETSPNFLHSMMITSSDTNWQYKQDEVFAIIQKYVFWSLTSSAMNLMVAGKGKLEGGMSAEDIDLSWIAGLRQLGSVFHITDDSSASCTKAAQKFVPTCVPGDGHTVVELVGGKPKVVTLADQAYYLRKDKNGDKPHFLVDDLYRTENIETVFGSFDSAIACAGMLTDIVTAVDGALKNELADVPLYIAAADGVRDPNPAFDSLAMKLSVKAARKTLAKYFAPRYAAPADRKPLPPLPAQ